MTFEIRVDTLEVMVRVNLNGSLQGGNVSKAEIFGKKTERVELAKTPHARKMRRYKYAAAIAEGKTKKQALVEAGYSANYLSAKVLKDESTEDFLAEKLEEAGLGLKKVLEIYRDAAGAMKIEGKLENVVPDHKVRLEVASRLDKISGREKHKVDVNSESGSVLVEIIKYSETQITLPPPQTTTPPPITVEAETVTRTDAPVPVTLTTEGKDAQRQGQPTK